MSIYVKAVCKDCIIENDIAIKYAVYDKEQICNVCTSWKSVTFINAHNLSKIDFSKIDYNKILTCLHAKLNISIVKCDFVEAKLLLRLMETYCDEFISHKERVELSDKLCDLKNCLKKTN